MNQHDAVACAQNDFLKSITLFVEEIHRDDTSLDDKHLLQITDSPFDGFVIMRRFDETSFVGEQSKLERRMSGRKEFCYWHLRIGAYYFRVRDASVSDSLHTGFYL
jgi:hypothetical protein